MKRISARSIECTILLLTIAAYCRPAHAYVDMGTGSYIIQVSIAAVAGALFWIKMSWSGIRAKLRAVMAPRSGDVANLAAAKTASQTVSKTPLDGE